MGFLSRAVDRLNEKRWHPAKWPGKNQARAFERWMITGKYSSDNYTGKDINEDSALSATALWCGLIQLTQTPASLPLHLYVRKDRGKDKAINHRQYGLLHLKPNPEMTSMSFREQQMGQILRYGTCYAEIERTEGGWVKNLWPLVSSWVKPWRAENKELFYDILVPPNGEKVTVESSRILKVVGFSNNGIIGYNPIEIHQEALGYTLALEEYGARYFGNGAIPNAVLEHPGELTEPAQDRLRESWNKIHKGLENSHRLAILEEGMKLHQFENNPENSQMIESRKFQIEEVARILNMPVHMLKNLDRSTNNNIEFQGIEFVVYTLRPWLVRFEQAYNMQLLTDKEQKKYFYEHTVDGLLRGDSETRHKTYALGRQWGYYCANDILEMENKNCIGPSGDIYLQPMNMINAKEADNFIKEKTKDTKKNPDIIDIDNNDDKDKKAFLLSNRQIERIFLVRKRILNTFERLFKDSILKILNREGIAFKRSIEKKSKIHFIEWFNEFYNDHYDYVIKIISPMIRSYIETVSHQIFNEIMIDEQDRKIDDIIINLILNEFAQRHIIDSRKYFKDLIDINKIESYINNRSDSEAYNESIRIMNIISKKILEENGYNSFLRLIKDNPCEKCEDSNMQLSPEEFNTHNYCCCIVTI